MKRREGRISFALSGLLLLVLTVGALLRAVLTAYAPPVLYRPLLLAAGGCVLLAWGVGLLPRLRWLAGLGYLAAWGVLLWRRWAAVCYGALIMLRQVTSALAETFPVPIIGPAEAATAAEEALAASWWLGMVLAVWALLLSWAAARRRCWWATVLLTLPPLLPAVLSGVMPAWGSLVALAAVWMGLLLQSSVRNTTAAGQQMFVTLTASLAVLALLTALIPRETYVHPAWTAGARSWVLTRFEGLRETLSQGGASGEEVNLSAAGPLQQSGRTMLRIDSEVSGHFLLRGSAFGIYTGQSWENDDGADFEETWADLLFLPASQAMSHSLASDTYYYTDYTDTYYYTDAEDITFNISNMKITPVGDQGAYAYCPYQPVGPVQSSLAADRDVGILSLQEEDSYRVYFTGTDPEDLRAAWGGTPAWEDNYADYVEDHYTEVPGDLKKALREVLMLWVDGEVQPELPDGIPSKYYETLQAADVVARCLAEWAEYDPDVERTPEGEDFVEHFLSERRGYCMHFASAGALLLRYLDIPARYVTGYNVDIPDSGKLDVSDAAAHAWVEIYLDGYGWYPVEMTPGYEEEDQEVQEPENPTETPETPDNPAETPEPETPEELPAAELEGPFTIHPAVWLGALVLLGLTGWHFGLSALRRRRLNQPNPNRAVIAAYRSMERMQKWGGELDPRLTELGGKARFSQYTLTEEERAEAVLRLEETAKDLEKKLPRWRRWVFRWLWGR